MVETFHKLTRQIIANSENRCVLGTELGVEIHQISTFTLHIRNTPRNEPSGRLAVISSIMVW